MQALIDKYDVEKEKGPQDTVVEGRRSHVFTQPCSVAEAMAIACHIKRAQKPHKDSRSA
jgi:uncharacterized protein YqgV (UPF0045/DUF77 family)